MADYPPFMNSYGLISKILDKIKEAQTPERFTTDFQGTKLGYASGSARPFISFAKRLGLLASDGSPTDLYKSFRNPSQSGFAMAKALKIGYAQLYERNEYAHDLSKDKLEGLVLEITGLEKGNTTARAIVYSFQAVKAFARFDGGGDSKFEPEVEETTVDEIVTAGPPKSMDFRIGYTINLNLPESSDVAVFNAIFKALKENLLNDQA